VERGIQADHVVAAAGDNEHCQTNFERLEPFHAARPRFEQAGPVFVSQAGCMSARCQMFADVKFGRLKIRMADFKSARTNLHLFLDVFVAVQQEIDGASPVQWR